MGLFDRVKGPVFCKDDSDSEKQLSVLNSLLEKASGDIADTIQQDICLVNAGILGEKQVRFELENSHIPMYVLHDVFLEHNKLTAQIDYIIITHHHIFVIECKNLYGDIEINSSGDFIRTITYGHRTKKEGIYSPITQNRRHLELIKEIRAAEKNLLQRALFENSFYSTYRSVVVLSNPKTVLNSKYAKKEIRNQVIRADQLSDYIKRIDAESDSPSFGEKHMEELADFFIKASKPHAVDYTEKYSCAVCTEAKTTPDSPAVPETVFCPKCGAPMVKRKATRGENIGNEFFGCSNFPKCRGIVNL